MDSSNIKSLQERKASLERILKDIACMPCPDSEIHKDEVKHYNFEYRKVCRTLKTMIDGGFTDVIEVN